MKDERMNHLLRGLIPPSRFLFSPSVGIHA
jgi:hypothetical protein